MNKAKNRLSLTALIGLLILMTGTGLKSQKLGFAERLIIGSSLTYVPDSQFPQAVFHELSWSKNIAVNVTDFAYFGIEHINVFTKGDAYVESDQRKKYFLVGLFSQVDFIRLFSGLHNRLDSQKMKKLRLFAELSYYYGNYCTCGDFSPYMVDGLNYLGWGGGVEYPLTKWLSVEASLKFNHILTKIPRKYNYNLYIIGLNIDLTGKSK